MFYLNACVIGQSVGVIEFVDGKKRLRKIPYEPTLFQKSKGKTGYTTIDGIDVEPVHFDNINEARDFIKRKPINDKFGLSFFEYTWLYENYKEEINYNFSDISIVYIDIEVDSSNGFANPINPTAEVISIALRKNEKNYVLGLKDFIVKDNNTEYFKCSNEKELLLRFITLWKSREISPDIVSGWNSENYDLPYLVNRMNIVLGEEHTKKLSPWGSVRVNEKEVGGRILNNVKIKGISCLDYLSLDKKFSFKPRESYKLDNIALVELEEQKVDYSEYGSLHELYEKNYQKFIEYNIHDAALIQKLEDKMGLIKQVVALSYKAKVNFEDALGTVRIWDVIIHNYLAVRKIVIPFFIPAENYSSIEGGYVKDPIIGSHEWVASFDVNSLYPSLIQQYNISPETYVGKINFNQNMVLDGEIKDITEKLKKSNYNITASGCCFSNNKQGFLPALMEQFYEERKIFKKKMQDLKKKNDSSLEDEVQRLDNMQKALKTLLNSAYGALANKYYRWFDPNLARSITLSGQMVIKWAEKKINQYFNKILKTSNQDYVILIDTDSIYLRINDVVKKYKEKDSEKVLNFVDVFCTKKIEKILEDSFEELSDITNAFQNKIVMKREVIGDRAILCGKKHYIIRKLDEEGYRLPEPEIKMMGIEAIKTSIPMAIRKHLKSIIQILLDDNKGKFYEYVEKIKDEFEELSFEDMSSPTSVNKVEYYDLGDGKYRKGTPMHVKSAIGFNNYIIKESLTNKVPLIQSGDKIKYVRLNMPNPFDSEVLANVELLQQFIDVKPYINYYAQMERVFLKPLKPIVDAVGWPIEKVNTLDIF